MRIVQISDTHGLHHSLGTLPEGDVIVHCGDFTENGTEEEVFDFINWFESLSYRYKLFVCGNHDLCLRNAEDIEDLQEGMYFLQDRGITIEGISFFGIGFDHNEELIPEGTDVVISHKPPLHTLDSADGINWGNLAIKERISQIKPRYHLFGHAHDANGVGCHNGTVFSNASLLDSKLALRKSPRVFDIH